MEEQNIGLETTEEAKQELVVEGYNPLFGARPLRRTIQRMVENPISSMIIKGEVKSGDIVNVDFDGKDFIFTAKIHPKRFYQEQAAGEDLETKEELQNEEEKADETVSGPEAASSDKPEPPAEPVYPAPQPAPQSAPQPAPQPGESEIKPTNEKGQEPAQNQDITESSAPQSPPANVREGKVPQSSDNPQNPSKPYTPIPENPETPPTYPPRPQTPWD